VKRIIINFANSPLQVFIVFTINLLLGAYLFSFLENVPLSSGLWWAIVTASTVGYGQIVPETGAGQILGSYFILINFLFLGPLIVASILINLIQDKNEFTKDEQDQLLTNVRILLDKIEEVEKLEKIQISKKKF
jgi:voltage-gated potassium channel